MSFRPDHEIYRRRFSRNVGLGLVLGAFVILIFGLTVVKVTRMPPMPAADKAAAMQGLTGTAAPQAGASTP